MNGKEQAFGAGLEGVRLRGYRDSDLSTLIEIMRRHLADYVTRHLGPWAQSVAMLQAEMPPARDDIQVVEKEGEIVGFLWVEDQADCLFLEEIHVTESARGLGLGRRLMAQVEAQARARGHREIRLAVFQESPQNAFYARFGFEVAGESPERSQRHWRKVLGPGSVSGEASDA